MSWTCPYCNQVATLLSVNLSVGRHNFDNNNKEGPLTLSSTVVVCPNSKCKEFTVNAILNRSDYANGSYKIKGDPILTWALKPQSFAKIIPEYVPLAIRDDYKEACSIATLSPKASATLARRCLQGMIRDFHEILGKTLFAEIQQLKPKIDNLTWNAIDAVRSIGNIGAHMEADISIIVDVDPDEAQLLIGLIETLIEEWYVDRYDREQKMKKIIEVAASKKDQKGQFLPSAHVAQLPAPKPSEAVDPVPTETSTTTVY